MAAQSISVIMATYNGEAWIGDQLRSIAGQTRAPDELIVTDDGSTDRTTEIVREFSKSVRFPVRLMRGPSTGHADNFWSATLACTSDLVAWSDQDDVWHPRKLEVCERRILETDASVVSHSATVTDENLTSLHRRFPDYRLTRVLGRLEGDPWQVMSGFTILFRREIVSCIDWQHRPLSHQSGVPIGHDHALSLVSFVSGKRARIAEPLALYRQHASNLAGAPNSLTLRDSMRIGLVEYRADGKYAREYFDFLSRCGLASPEIEAYYEALESRCDRRADIYEPGSFFSRIRRLQSAVLHGVYGSRETGHFRIAALAKDLTDVVANPIHPRPE